MDYEQRRRAANAWQNFLESSLDHVLERHLSANVGATAVGLFKEVAARVPAYRRFLDEHGIDPSSIRSYDDFQRLPLTTKENYLRRAPLAELCRDGTIESCDMIAVSSGSTGQPQFWPRFFVDELAVARRFEQVYRDSFAADTRRTLAVVCFALGTWVGGIYTANCSRYLASKGYPVTVITPGNNKDEIFRVVQELGPAFEQVVLLGYPPFLKDVIDTGKSRGIAWQDYAIKLVTAGEVFTEEWRTLVGERVGSTNPVCDSASLYGTADAGVLGNETPLSITIRRFLARTPLVARELFGESRLPTLVQYDPLSRFFETEGDTLLFSGDNGVPLIRYHIADTGGLIGYQDMLRVLSQYGFDALGELKQHTARLPHRLPFVYVFGRSHFTVSFFGANIYPENISVGLEQPEVSKWVTGKFVLESLEDADRNRFFQIVVELAPGVEASDDKPPVLGQTILRQLVRLNSEFANYVPPQYQAPRILLAATGDPDYFPLGVKHRYTRAPRQPDAT